MAKKQQIIGIADNHVQTAITVSEVLDNEGYKTIQAYNFEDAIKIAKEEKPDLMVVGGFIDGKTCFDLAKALPNQKMALVTDCVHSKGALKNFKNIKACMQKPVDNDVLLRVVKKLLEDS
jgi:two-component system response regulator (stage 0 sporulation protein F)